MAQDNFLFDRSIRENIRMGDPSATDAEVEAAARAANCHDFIMNLEQGYDTLAGDAGDRLSGGERQRITIARAMLKRRPSSSWTRQPPSLTPRARRRSNRPSPAWCGARP